MRLAACVYLYVNVNMHFDFTDTGGPVSVVAFLRRGTTVQRHSQNNHNKGKP